MTTFDRDPLFDPRVSDWLEADPDRAPEIVLDTVTAAFGSIPQRRSSRAPWRFPAMITPARLAVAAVFGVLLLSGAFFAFGTGRTSVGGPGPTPSSNPTAMPSPLPSLKSLTGGPLSPGSYSIKPFSPAGLGMCYGQTGCTEDPADDSITLTFTVPDGWEAGSIPVIWRTDTQGVGLVFERGGSLYVEPCGTEPPPNIPVGPTVDDFVDALTSHQQKLDVTPPVGVTLDGYRGKYVELLAPADLTACSDSYYPWEPGLYAQGPNHRWHLWILDVDGVRVVIQSMDYASTSTGIQAELQAIVDSIQIEP